MSTTEKSLKYLTIDTWSARHLGCIVMGNQSKTRHLQGRSCYGTEINPTEKLTGRWGDAVRGTCQTFHGAQQGIRPRKAIGADTSRKEKEKRKGSSPI